jgi:retron-type reverse transcriptase
MRSQQTAYYQRIARWEGRNLSGRSYLKETMSASNDRQLQLFDEGQPQRVEAVPRWYAEASRRAWNTKADEFSLKTSKQSKDLLEEILDPDNMYDAYLKVIGNKGAGGVDNMTVSEMEGWLDNNYSALKSRLLTGKYRHMPVRRVEIPKEEKGKVRLLGIPAVTDRMVQQAVSQVLSPIYEPLFSSDSFGFRPNRSAHDALLRIKEHADNGNVWCVSLDLERFFDTVNQSKLIQLLSNTIKDGRVISLIHRFLMAGVEINGEF